MDRTTLNIVPALRLLLVGGLFAMFWIIFGAGSAHAAAPTPPGESSNTGLIPSLTAPVKPLITTAPRTEPAPASTAAPAPEPGPASTARPLGGTAPAAAPTTAQGPATVLQEVTAPVTGVAGAAVAPLTASVTQLVTDTVQPLLAPVTGLAGSVLNPLDAVTRPVAGLITGITTAAVTGPVSGILRGSRAATAASPVAPLTANTSPSGADKSRTTVESLPAAVRGAKPSPSTAFTPLFMGIADGSAPRGAASMADGGASPQSPPGLPSGNEPATVPVLSTVSGGVGASGPTGAGAQAAADLSYRLVLPMTQGGDGSLFSFVLPGSTTHDPGFSPD